MSTIVNSQESQEITTTAVKSKKVLLTKEEKETRKQERKIKELEDNLNELVQLKSSLEEIKLKIKKLEKRNRKLSPKKNKTKSGIVKPMPISLELSSYLNLPSDTEIARSTVSKLLSQIFEEKGLKQGNIINAHLCEDTLKLFGGKPIFAIDSKHPDTLGFSWQNIQKHLSPHFIKVEIVEKQIPETSEVPAVKAKESKEPKKPKKSDKSGKKKT